MNEEDVCRVTKDTIEIVKDYIKEKNVDKIIVSSTTGYTADIFSGLNVIEPSKCYICKQDLNNKYYMDDKKIMKLEEEGYHVVDIPKKYLTNLIGIKSVSILRAFSQGIKVCVELLEYLIGEKKVKCGDSVVLIAGTIRGADTAIYAVINENDYFLKIICLPKK